MVPWFPLEPVPFPFPPSGHDLHRAESREVPHHACGRECSIARAIGNALLSSTTSKLGALKCDAFDVPLTATSLDLRGRSLGSAAATLLAGVIKFNGVLTELK